LEDLLTEATIQEMTITEVSASSMARGSIVRKTGLSRIPTWTIQFPQRNQKLLGSSANSGFASQSLLLMVQGVVRTRNDRGMKLWPMMEQNKTWRKVQRRLQWSRIRLRQEYRDQSRDKGQFPEAAKPDNPIW
jgi:hypothetical protein